MPEYKHDIELSIACDNSTVKLSIKDYGVGIPEHELHNIQHGKSLKQFGNGIGLSSSIQYIKGLNGTLDIKSIEGTGTTINITLPKIDNPTWFKLKLQLPFTHKLVVIDVDPQILSARQNKLYPLKSNLMYFCDIDAFVQWYTAESNAGNDKITVLIDYDLRDPNRTGLDLLKSLKITNACLITKCAEQAWLQTKIENTNYFMLPKDIFEDLVIEAV